MDLSAVNNLSLRESNDKDNKVQQLQRDLRLLGYFTAGADGVFGKKTKAAVIAYQIARGLIQDENDSIAGTVDQKTAATIQADLKKIRTHPPTGGRERLPAGQVPPKIGKLWDIIPVLDANPNVQVVSFDLIDTLLYYRSPYADRRAKYFRKAAIILNRNGIPATAEDFKRVRGYRNEKHEDVPGILDAMRKASPEGVDIKTTDIGKAIINELCKQKNVRINPGRVATMAQELEDAFAEVELQSTALMPGAEEVLREIKSRGKRIVLLSNLEESKKQVVKYLRRMGIFSYFNNVYVSSDSGASKHPKSPIFFQQMLKATRASPRDVIHVGDNPRTDIQGAKAAGISGILYEEDPLQKKARMDERKKPLAETQGAVFKKKRQDALAVRMRAENMPEAETKELSTRMYELARDYYGPAAMGLAVELLQSLQKNPKQLNICVGRDSLSLFILQKLLLRECKSQFPEIDGKRIQYVPLSRKLIGSHRSSVQEWRSEMARKRPEINTLDEDKIRRLLHVAGIDDYSSINIIDHSLAGTTQDRIEELYPKKDIHGTYLVSKTRGPEPRRKTGYFVGRNITGNHDVYDNYNASRFGAKFKDMSLMEEVWLVEFFFNGIETSGEHFTGEEVGGKPAVNKRKLGLNAEERKQKILRLAAIHGMIDSVKLYGEDVVLGTQQEQEKRIAKFYEWLKAVSPRDGSAKRSPADDALYKILFTRNQNVKPKKIKEAGAVLARPAAEAPRDSMESKLSKLHAVGSYKPLDLSVREAGNGDAAGGYCNEKKFTREDPNFKEIQSPNGYIIGAGAGSIWSMIQFFNKPEDLKGIIAFDIDPAVVLFGKTLVELARKGVDKDEMIAYLYGGKMAREIGVSEEDLARSEADYLKIAKSVVDREKNPDFRTRLEKTMSAPANLKTLKPTLQTGFARGVLLFDRSKRRDRYFHRAASHRVRMQEDRRKLNIAHVLYREWDKIVSLAQQGKISFLHASFKDAGTLESIRKAIPDIGAGKNIIYTSNVIDNRYVPDVKELDAVCNAGKKSVYVSTKLRDDYVLKATKTPPEHKEAG